MANNSIRVVIQKPLDPSSLGVQTVTGAIVDNTDPQNPVIINTSGTNTGDQDLSGLQPILLEGAFVDGDKTKLDGIEANAEVNTINSKTAGEPTGSDVVLNTVSLTQAEYDLGTPIATTFYIITDA